MIEPSSKWQPTNVVNDGGYGSWKGRVADCGLRPHSKADFFLICNYVVRQNLSDLVIQSGKPILSSHHGAMLAITRVLGQADVERIIGIVTGRESALFHLNGGNDLDDAFSIPDIEKKDDFGEAVRHRFRLNITPVMFNGGTGFQLVMRYISTELPTKDSVDLETEILANATPQQGGVVFLGEVGSGKTSTIAAVMGEILQGNSHITGNLVTYESPIEFDFENIPSPVCICAQTEVPTFLPTFSHAARNSLRRKPALVMLGELRDNETIEAASELMTTGVPMLSTAHANNVSVGFSRLIQKFPTNLQTQAFFHLVANIHMFVAQRLVRHREWTIEHPKMVCLREWRVMTHDIRIKVEAAGPERHVRVLRDILNETAPDDPNGRSMLTSIRRHYKDGALSLETTHRMLLTYGYHLNDLKAT